MSDRAAVVFASVLAEHGDEVVLAVTDWAIAEDEHWLEVVTDSLARFLGLKDGGGTGFASALSQMRRAEERDGPDDSVLHPRYAVSDPPEWMGLVEPLEVAA